MSRPELSAVSPEFCIEGRDVSDFVTEFGPFTGRYVSKLPRNWIKDFQAHISALADQDRLEAVALLGRVKAALADLPRGVVYNADQSWIENILAVNRTQPFRHIVGNALSPEPFLEWAKALRTIRDTPSGGRVVIGTAQDYMEEIEPLLSMSPECFLIDPYFRIVDQSSDGLLRSHPLLTEICSAVTGSRCYRIHVVVRKKLALNRTELRGDERVWSVEEFSDAVAKQYQPWLARDRQLMVHMVRDDPNDGSHLRLHSRYFLTKYGALDFGYGFKMFSSRSRAQVPVKVVPKVEHAYLEKSYIFGVARFLERVRRSLDVLYPWDVTTICVSAT